MATYESNLRSLAGQASSRAAIDAKRRFVRALTPPPPGLNNRQPTLSRRWGKVTAINSNGTVNVLVEKTTIPNVATLASYMPAVNDTVIMDLLGSDPVVIGTTTTAHQVVFRGRQTATQSINNNVDSITIALNTIDEDPFSGYNGVTGNYTVPTAGLYLVTAAFSFQSNPATGTFFFMIVVAGVAVGHTGPRYNLSAFNTPGATRSLVARMAVGTTISMSVFQNSGVAINTSGDTDTEMEIVKIGN